MGTRSITRVIDENEEVIIEMYQQYDGYPSGVGKDLLDFLEGGTVVNGFGSETPKKAWNGVGCLAASLVAHFKVGIGGVYLHAPISKKARPKRFWKEYFAEYVYVINHKGELNGWDTYTGKKIEKEAYFE